MRGSLMVRTSLLAALAAMGPGPGYGQVPMRGLTAVQPVIIWGWPYDPALMQWGYWYSPCYPFVSCSAYQQFQLWERRQERLDQLRHGHPMPAPAGIQNKGAAMPGRATRATNDADVRPDYIESGRIRDQYARSGEVLPEFLDRPAGPSR
jgi:hypothetical protein